MSETDTRAKPRRRIIGFAFGPAAGFLMDLRRYMTFSRAVKHYVGSHDVHLFVYANGKLIFMFPWDQVYDQKMNKRLSRTLGGITTESILIRWIQRRLRKLLSAEEFKHVIKTWNYS